MINQEKFVELMTELSLHFGKEIGSPFLNTLYAQLCEQMNTEQFTIAAKKLLTARFFPCYEDFINAAFGTFEKRATDEWGDFDNLSTVGKKALAQIGGRRAVESSSNYAYLRNTFVSAYCAIATTANTKDFEPLPKIAPAPNPPQQPLERQPVPQFVRDLLNKRKASKE